MSKYKFNKEFKIHLYDLGNNFFGWVKLDGTGNPVFEFSSRNSIPVLRQGEITAIQNGIDSMISWKEANKDYPDNWET